MLTSLFALSPHFPSPMTRSTHPLVPLTQSPTRPSALCRAATLPSVCVHPDFATSRTVSVRLRVRLRGGAGGCAARSGRSCRLDLPAPVRPFSSTRLLQERASADVQPTQTCSAEPLASHAKPGPPEETHEPPRLPLNPPRLLIQPGLLSHVAPLIRSGASESGASVRTRLRAPLSSSSPSLVSPFVSSVLAAASLPSHARSVRPSSLLFSPRSSTSSPARQRPSFRGLHPPRTRRLQSPIPLQRPRHPIQDPNDAPLHPRGERARPSPVRLRVTRTRDLPLPQRPRTPLPLARVPRSSPVPRPAFQGPARRRVRAGLDERGGRECGLEPRGRRVLVLCVDFCLSLRLGPDTGEC